MIARVQDTTQGFVLVIPPEYVKAWGLRQDFALEVHRVGSTHEQDEPAAIREANERIMQIYRETLPRHEAVYRELANGPDGRGLHDDDFAPSQLFEAEGAETVQAWSIK